MDVLFLGSDQKAAVRDLNKGRPCLVIGGAGTGKSTAASKSNAQVMTDKEMRQAFPEQDATPLTVGAVRTMAPNLSHSQALSVYEDILTGKVKGLAGALVRKGDFLITRMRKRAGEMAEAEEARQAEVVEYRQRIAKMAASDRPDKDLFLEAWEKKIADLETPPPFQVWDDVRPDYFPVARALRGRVALILRSTFPPHVKAARAALPADCRVHTLVYPHRFGVEMPGQDHNVRVRKLLGVAKSRAVVKKSPGSLKAAAQLDGHHVITVITRTPDHFTSSAFVHVVTISGAKGKEFRYVVADAPGAELHCTRMYTTESRPFKSRPT